METKYHYVEGKWATVQGKDVSKWRTTIWKK